MYYVDFSPDGIRIRIKKTPQLRKNGDLLVKVSFVGLCGSDIVRYDDFLKNKKSIPILGHEIVGKLVESGSSEILPGDSVCILPFTICKKCSQCLLGNSQFCKNATAYGKNINGGLQEYIVCNENQLYKISSNNEVFVLADPLACILNMVRLIKNPKDKKICIFGQGTMALLAYEILSIDNNVTLVIKRHDDCLSNKKFILYDDIKYSKDLFDIVIDCTGGGSNILNDEIRVCDFNGTIAIMSVYHEDDIIIISPRPLFYKQINLIGINSYLVNDEVDDYLAAINYIEKNWTSLKYIISDKLDIKDFLKGIYLYKTKDYSKSKKIVFTTSMESK